MKYVVDVSKSRAKRKQRQRARPPGAAPRGGGAPAETRPDGPAGGKASEGAQARGGAGAKAGSDARRPEPVWAPFPLTEIGMGVGIVIFGVGYLTTNARLVAVGAVVLAVVVAELCVREHFAGFRSHALLIAALTVVAAHSLVFAIADGYRGPVALAVDLAIGGGLAWWLRKRFAMARERASVT